MFTVCRVKFAFNLNFISIYLLNNQIINKLQPFSTDLHYNPQKIWSKNLFQITDYFYFYVKKLLWGTAL
jgi:hypothetical protein